MPRFEPHPARRPTIVAGASSGIGAATAIELAGRGFPVALGARRIDKLNELVAEIRAGGGEAVAFPLDVTDADSVKSFVAQSIDALGEIEVLVSGAGDMLPGRLHEISTEAFTEQIHIHLVGANRLATAVLPDMVARRRGDVIFVGSDVALRQRPHMGAYGAAKAGLIAMVTNLQMELEGTGVRASIVHPGPTLTGMGWQLSAEQVGPMLEDWAKWGQARHNYFLRPSDIARAIAFVAETPRGSFVVNMEIQPEAPLTDAPPERHELKLDASATWGQTAGGEAERSGRRGEGMPKI
ncbi:oxidoreductase [Mycobacterium botniense]|uniref:Oxidoreductase n=1 Tax=Mycobacterium botniense TaxID=84962 RepID=A0A7I9XX35_9MYCO|nr:oxidoreductase [Mycobacterium botniense]